VLICDDRKATFIASMHNVECRGTLHLVFLGVRKGAIKSKKEAIVLVSQFVGNGLYLSSDVLSENFAKFFDVVIS
jgi:predicted nucleic acid-binding protein